MKKIAYVLFLSVLAFVGLTPSANAAVIDHDKVIGFKEVTPVTVTQKAAKRFQPYLKVASGCVPFPAVDAQGNTSGGLEPTGAPEGHCSKSVGQVYSRSAWYNGVWAIMYAWYFPKDSPIALKPFGHRHDWEGIVVWIDNPANQNPKVLSIAYSQHGKFAKTAPNSHIMDGDHPKIRYDAPQSPINHSLYVDSAKGGMQPLIGWEDLTPAARNALNTADFGSANVPFNDPNFMNHLGKAWFR
ncbi:MULTISPECIES: NPP1 family protein [unclassified Bacillus (in: firmicutes)]|uniref:NPP1 family protein n=1 Tax=unclassified Bacillus (in: firmicutes) TaxID=185979 RepID=UPI0004270073|nr:MULTISPECIES: NPP1 family protein [unclassified Bacillus (in: firmicutes)]QHZ46302.1 necrosis and ethylene inducing protein [Bacillus sp. NSP9.1]WFA06525.1 NPP1 family protein [Bacillus sp. HSf4]